jgi:predicted RNA-binding Zn-ribbon protein involved in translation (DUF1610 family)
VDYETGFAISSEGDHAHECPECGSVWLHQNDECEVDGALNPLGWYTGHTCPECDG